MPFDNFFFFFFEAKDFKISPPLIQPIQQLYAKRRKKGACSAQSYPCRQSPSLNTSMISCIQYDKNVLFTQTACTAMERKKTCVDVSIIFVTNRSSFALQEFPKKCIEPKTMKNVSKQVYNKLHYNIQNLSLKNWPFKLTLFNQNF